MNQTSLNLGIKTYLPNGQEINVGDIIFSEVAGLYCSFGKVVIHDGVMCHINACNFPEPISGESGTLKKVTKNEALEMCKKYGMNPKYYDLE